MPDGMCAPSAWRIEQAMSAWLSARARLLHDDTDLAGDEAALAALLGPEEGEIRDILHRTLRASMHAKAMAEAADQQISDIRARRDRFLRRAEQGRATVFAIMEALGERRAEFPDCTAIIAAPRPGVVVVDEAALPAEFVRVKREPDKTAIGAALKAGQDVPGAEMQNGMPTLSVRTK